MSEESEDKNAGGGDRAIKTPKEKHFTTGRPCPEVMKLAKEKGLGVNTDKFDNEGSDYITLTDDKNKRVIVYNTFNARFIVSDQKHEIIATEASANLDNEPWYAELLDLFYTGELK